jgi:hypothetical protein
MVRNYRGMKGLWYENNFQCGTKWLWYEMTIIRWLPLYLCQSGIMMIMPVFHFVSISNHEGFPAQVNNLFKMKID